MQIKFEKDEKGGLQTRDECNYFPERIDPQYKW
jgi:hypothetical protein